MIVVQNLTLRPGESERKLWKLAARELGVPEEAFTSFSITKKSLDARKKRDIRYVYAVAVTVEGAEEPIAARSSRASVQQPYQ